MPFGRSLGLGGGDAIFFKTYGEFLRVNVKGTNKDIKTFHGSLGLMGRYPTGSKVARDNHTIFSETDTNQFGLEWQVRHDEPMLFHVIDGVQHPTPCRMPTVPSPLLATTTEGAEAGAGAAPGRRIRRRRRLQAGLVSLEEAEMACAHVQEESVRMTCVEDALVTGNLDLAKSY